jgi:CHAD domain-containing protein
LAKLAEKMEALPKRTKNPAKQHKVRILAKRLRYGIETLHPLLPNKRAERWYRSATRQQSNIGLDRDLLQAVLIAQRLGAAKGIVEFLRDPRPVAVSIKV